MKLHLERQLYPHFILSAEEDLILGLIRKGLQINQCLEEWEDFGMDTTRWLIDPGPLVLHLMGYPNPGDALYTWFFKTTSRLIAEVKAQNLTMSAATLHLYSELKDRHAKDHTQPSL